MTVVAIDGPAGAGKSAVARETARRLGFRHVDTGAMYRAVALAALERGLDPGAAGEVARLAADIGLEVTGTLVVLDGNDVTERIRDDDVTAAAPVVASIPGVRTVLVALQRTMADGGDVVMEGRDIGSTVVPDAAVKVFLTASPRERARRRCRQLGLDDSDEVVTALEAAIAARDELDSSRASSPLVRAPDAVLMDSTDQALDDVVEAVVALVRSVTEDPPRARPGDGDASD